MRKRKRKRFILPCDSDFRYWENNNMEERKPKSLQELARDAIACQDACNILGLARSFGLEVLPDLRAALTPSGNAAVQNHPITRLWVSKLHDLAGMGISNLDRFAEAMQACEQLAAGEPMAEPQADA